MNNLMHYLIGVDNMGKDHRGNVACFNGSAHLSSTKDYEKVTCPMCIEALVNDRRFSNLETKKLKTTTNMKTGYGVGQTGTITKEMEKIILERFEGRADAQGYKGKARLKAQAEFVLGAICVLDELKNKGISDERDRKSTISPNLFFGIMRGEYLEPTV